MSERMRKLVALPVLSADALSSVAFGPEAMLTVLVLAGSAGLAYSFPVSGAIVFLMAGAKTERNADRRAEHGPMLRREWPEPGPGPMRIAVAPSDVRHTDVAFAWTRTVPVSGHEAVGRINPAGPLRAALGRTGLVTGLRGRRQ
ncbi:hypothetical protein ACFZB5_34505 [Streptomyces nodosus]|uniref:hypothetical protein n=1 Tax=Streptomyces nodosus TaxID=40318 RepID=UPI0036F094E2